jgi:hypothetical protein
MTMPEGSRAKVLRPGDGRYVVIGERAAAPSRSSLKQ